MDTPVDEISMISSRIDINRKGINNSVFDIISSNRKKNLESSRILESLKKNTDKITMVNKIQQKSGFKSKNPIKENKVRHEMENVESYNFKRVLNKENRLDRRNSLKLLKKSLNENKMKNLGKYKDTMDAIFKTHQ